MSAKKKSLSTHSKVRKKFILEHLPVDVFNDLCRILDGAKSWELLGGKHLRYTLLELNEFNRGESGPSKTMLTNWGYKNGSIDHLFIHLLNMQHFRAAGMIYPYVTPENQQLLSNRPEFSIFAAQNYDSNSSFSGLCATKRLDDYPEKSLMSNLKSFQLNKKSEVNLDKKMPVEDGISEFNIDKSCVAWQQESRVLKKSEVHEKYIKSQSQDLKKTRENRDKGEIVEESYRESERSENYRRKSYEFSSIQSNSSLPQISFKEVQNSTNNFNTNILGQGGFGKVYSGIWKNTPVAIKFIEKKKNPCISVDDAKLQQSLIEIRALDSFRHKNIISLYGYSLNEDGLCLIYQLMTNGSLEDLLHCRKGNKPLNWMQRLNIVLGSACGIQYLHTVFSDQPFIHGDIKSANILLDENLVPKLGDFGLSREGPPSEKTHTYVKYINGTRAYLPLEYLTRNVLSTKVDTYGFGVVLFEVATGLRAYDELRDKEKKSLALYVQCYQPSKWINICDTKGGKEQSYLFHSIIELGYRCTEEKHKRPDMVKVYEELEMLAEAEKAKLKEAELLKSSLNVRAYSPSSSLYKPLNDFQENKYSYKPSQNQSGSKPDLEGANCQRSEIDSVASSIKVIPEGLKSDTAVSSVNYQYCDKVSENWLPRITELGLGEI